jgi:hypothetical protein
MSERTPGTRTYRTRGNAILNCCIAAVGFVIGVAGLVSIATSDGDARWAAMGILAAVWLLVEAWTIRILRARVVVTDSGVTVKNPFRTLHVRWKDVRRFDVEREGYHAPSGLLELVGGRVVRLHAVQGGITARGLRAVEGVVEQLNDELDGVRGGVARGAHDSAVLGTRAREPREQPRSA